MSDNTADAATGGSTPRKPTEKEAFFFLTILNSMKNKPEVDWDLVASRASYSNGQCAKTRFFQIKKAIGYNADSAAPDSPLSKTGGRGGSGTNKSPSKVQKKKTTPRKPRVKKAEVQDHDQKNEPEEYSASEQIKTETAANGNLSRDDICAMQYSSLYDQTIDEDEDDE